MTCRHLYHTARRRVRQEDGSARVSYEERCIYCREAHPESLVESGELEWLPLNTAGWITARLLNNAEASDIEEDGEP